MKCYIITPSSAKKTRDTKRHASIPGLLHAMYAYVSEGLSLSCNRRLYSRGYCKLLFHHYRQNAGRAYTLVLVLLRGQCCGFLPRMGDSLHRHAEIGSKVDSSTSNLPHRCTGGASKTGNFTKFRNINASHFRFSRELFKSWCLFHMLGICQAVDNSNLTLRQVLANC